MFITLDPDFDPFALPEKELHKILKVVMVRLGLWFNKEAKRRAKVNLKLKSPVRLAKRVLKFKRDGGESVKAWFGASPIGVDAWGDVQQRESGAYAAGELHSGSFVNYMDGNTPIVWRRSSSKRDAPLERVTKDIETDAVAIMELLALEVNDKFNELLEVELNAVL